MFYNLFDVVISTASDVERKKERKKRIEELVAKNGAYKIGQIWQSMGSMVANLDELLEAGRRQERSSWR